MSKAKDVVSVVPEEILMSKIYLFRGKKVMFDKDLAELYGVQTKVLNQSVKRNIKRFPPPFMFQLNKEELENWRSQIVTSNPKAKMALRQLPYVFTEQGVAMLSSVLNSERAIQVNIQIIMIFTKIREFLVTHEELRKKIEKIEMKLMNMDEEIKSIFDAIKQLMFVPKKPKKEIGFHTNME